jgi:hypothetical protein
LFFFQFSFNACRQLASSSFFNLLCVLHHFPFRYILHCIFPTFFIVIFMSLPCFTTRFEIFVQFLFFYRICFAFLKLFFGQAWFKVAMFNEWCLSLALVFNISKNMRGFFQWTWHEGIKFNIIGNKGCHLLPWLMLTHKQTNVSHFVLEALFNNQFSCVISYSIIVVENNFDIFLKLFINWWSSSI